MSNLVTIPNRQASVTGSAALMPSNMSDVLKLADVMASARLVPKHLQGQPGDCFMVIEQALRWNMSPFAVAQATSSIGGKLMFEGKLVAAAVETSGAIVGFMDYEFTGDGDARKVRAWATRRGESTPREVTVVFRDVRTDNGMWKKQPDQQLVYSASRIWARRWTPSVILGVYAPEEFDRSYEPPHTGRTIESTVRPGAAMDAALDGDTIPEQPDPKFPERVAAVITAANGAGTTDRLARIQKKAGPLLEELEQAGALDLRDQLLEAFTAARAAIDAPLDDVFPGDLPSDR